MCWLWCLCTVSLSGCITLAGDQLDDIEAAAPAEPQPIEQTVGAFSFHQDGGKMITSNKAGRILNQEILDRWVQSGYVRSHEYVKDSAFTERSTLRLTLSGHQEGDSNIVLQVFSGMTLLLIPYYSDSKMQVTYTFENVATGCTFASEASDSFNTIIGLLLLPATPFSQFGSSRTYERIADNLYQRLASQGAFDSGAPCTAGG